MALLVELTAGAALPQELVPRRWSHLPVGTNFVGAGYAYTRGDISFDPVLQVEDAKLDLHTFEVSYLRTLEVLGKLARVDLRIPYQDARWKGLLAGEPASVHRSGLADPVLRLAANLVGAPPLNREEFAAYRAANEVETIVGIGVATSFPLGQYYDDKLLNLGSNRFTFRPQLGVVHQRGKWTAEITGSAWLFTDNDSFLSGLRREQDPLLSVEAHLTYDFLPGFWATLSGGLGYGGESTIDDEPKDDTQRNVAWAVTLGAALTRQLGLKVSYVGLHNRSEVGADTNTVIVGASYFW